MAMADNEKGDTASSKEGEAWGTLEELLLACAVSRHGTKSWDSIAMEVQKRAASRNRNSQKSDDDDNEKYNNFLNAFTPLDCEQRYQALKRRFNVTGDGERNDRPAGDDDAGDDDAGDTGAGERELREKLPFMVDELRKLRVEELRREVERHDDSIVSLELKVKRLQEERERSSLKAEPVDGEADLGTKADRVDAGDERRDREPDGSSAEVADKSVSSERSDEPEDRSFNESNSTGHKGAPAQGRESSQGREPDQNRNSEPDPVRPAAESELDKDCSSSRGRGIEEEEKVVGRTSPPGRLGNLGELKESVSESKREGKESGAPGEAKQSSDVQSSASLSRRKRRGWRPSDGVGFGSSGDEMEAEELSPANKRMDVKSQPLIKCLEILRSHKHGVVFQRRLPSQETEKYRNLIRQHMDLETVQSKLDRGIYCDCHPKFYRDMLLIFTNAMLFFCKSSTEHMAARELRKMIIKEIVAQRVARKPIPALPIKPDLESQILDPVVKKPRSSTNIVVCRRRTSSTTTKPSSLSSEQNIARTKEEEVENESLRTKTSADQQQEADNAKDEPKKLKRERSNLGGRSLAATTTSNNNASSSSKKGKGSVQQGESNNSNNASANNKSNKDESSDEEEQPINKRRKQLLTSRKQGVVNFLKRMTQNSPSKEVVAAKSNDTEEQQEERTKKTAIGKKKVVAGRKKDGNGGGGGNDDAVAKRRVSGRRSTKGKEVGKSEVVKRGGGRPPARKAAVGSSGGGAGGSLDSGRLKRRRDGEKQEVGASGKNSTAKKKARR